MGADRYLTPVEKTAEELAADAAAFLASREQSTEPAIVPPTETKTYSDGTTVTGPGPLPELSPAQQELHKVLQTVNAILSDNCVVDAPWMTDLRLAAATLEQHIGVQKTA